MFFVHSKAFTASTCVSAYGISGLFKILPTRGYYLQVYAVGDAPQPICPEDSPFPWEGTGEADGLPSPLSPTHKLRTAAPGAHRTWDWAVCRNALWVNRLWSAIYPFHSWGLDRSLPRSLLARRQERCYTAHRSPVPGGPLRCVTRIGPPKGILTSSTHVPVASPFPKKSVNFGELSAPLISGARRPAPRPPSGDGSRRPESPTLGLCHRPSP
ncbi:hypothetical protein GEV33_005867 [Tenebrio molitor]|uniref:Uncharacterized protein n=1 Tax=Tenebrio molitor TaxID=7067 RepID=A0A8J6HDQ3_TENMO|nr:hypothetical protein GEV33_005867 [Tenebrio molitor]